MNQWIEQHRTLILSIVGLLLVSAMMLFAIRWKTPAPITIEPPQPTPTPGPIQVYVSGAVLQADVYMLPPEAIARDAINAAGGTTAEADIEHLNLAANLADGEHLYIPVVGESVIPAPSGNASAGPGEQTSFPININTASLEELQALPGIGPALALRIIDYRAAYGEFPDIEALQNVSGIGPATFEEMKALVTID
jgi:competence protein ComEA